MSRRNFIRHIQSQIKISTTRPTEKNNVTKKILSTNISLKSESINIESTEFGANILEIPLIDTSIIQPCTCIYNSTSYCKSNCCDESIEKHTFVEDFKNLISKYHVSHNFINELLPLLRNEGLEYLPKNVRTLLNTPSHQRVIEVHPGSYLHFGIEKMLTPILLAFFDNNLSNISAIKLAFNIDGLPIPISSKSCFWPILVAIENVKILSKLVVPVGIYYAK